jgi:Xaa-Pro dipeptidase
VNAARLQRLLERHGLAGAIATAPENLVWMADYDGFQRAWNRTERAAICVAGVERIGVVVPMAEVGFAIDQGIDRRCELEVYGAPNIIVPGGAGGPSGAGGPNGAGKPNAAEPSVALEPDDARIAAVLTERAHPDPWSAILSCCARLGLGEGRVAVDRSGVAATPEALAAAGAPFAPKGGGEDLLRAARMVKTPSEVERLRAAADLNEAAIAAMLPLLGQLDDRELEAAHRAVVSAAGGHVQHWIGSPGRLAGAYRMPAGVRARPGERWRYDIGLILDGWISDLGGTAQVGAEPSTAERRAYEAITAGIDAAVAASRPGIRSAELYELTIAAVREAGLPDYRYSLVGHGIGVEPRDWPIVGPARTFASPYVEEAGNPVLEAGMVLNFEVPIVALGEGGFQHEVTVLVTEAGGELLSARRPYAVV